MPDDATKPEGRFLRGKIGVRPGGAVEFSEDGSLGDTPPHSEEIKRLLDTIGETLRTRANSTRGLLSGRFADQSNLVSAYYKHPCNIVVLCCSDGVFVRYERADGEPGKLRIGKVDAPLAKIAPAFSDNFIHCPEDPNTYDPGNNGPGFEMRIISPDGGQRSFGATHPVIYVRTTFPDDFDMPPPGSRPPCLACVDNDFDMQTGGLVLSLNPPPKAVVQEPQEFLAHTRFRLPVGWERIEIYPMLGDEYWRPEFAPMWAELDLLGTIGQRNSFAAQLLTLDGRGRARQEAIALLDQFEKLLTGDEEPVHQFLKRNPLLLSLTHEFYWSKLPFGDTVSDFVFREPQNDYVLVEIEAPHRDLFTRSEQPRHELTHAMQQIRDWVRYIEDNRPKVEEELGLAGISVNPRRLIVIGRSSGLTDSLRRNLASVQAEQNRLRIMTYDDVLNTARQGFEKLLGPLQIRAENAEIYYFESGSSNEKN